MSSVSGAAVPHKNVDIDQGQLPKSFVMAADDNNNNNMGKPGRWVISTHPSTGCRSDLHPPNATSSTLSSTEETNRKTEITSRVININSTFFIEQSMTELLIVKIDKKEIVDWPIRRHCVLGCCWSSGDWWTNFDCPVRPSFDCRPLRPPLLCTGRGSGRRSICSKATANDPLRYQHLINPK